MAPGDVNQVGTVVKYELLKYLRSRRLFILLVLIVVINALFLVIPPATGSEYPKDPKAFTENMLGFVNLLIIISATFFGADAIVSEFEQKTGFFLFPNPIKRHIIITGKFIGSALVSFGGLALYYAIIVLSVRIIDGGVAANVGLSFSYACLYLFAVVALAYFFSAIMRSSVTALVLTFFMLFMILPIVDAVGAIAKFKPWFSVTFAAGIITNILKQPYPKDLVQTIPTLAGNVSQATTTAPTSITIAQYYPDINQSIAVMVAYLVGALILSIIIARMRQM
jgi:ABC-2 type transport system permease protein